MVLAIELDYLCAPRVKAAEAYGAHDRLGAAHVEGDLVEAGDRTQLRQHREDRRVQRAEHVWSESLHSLEAVSQSLLVKIVSNHVDAVRTADVEAFVAVDVDEVRPLALLDDEAEAQPLATISRPLSGTAPAVIDTSDFRAFLMRPAPMGAMVQCYIQRRKSGLARLFPTYEVPRRAS